MDWSISAGWVMSAPGGVVDKCVRVRALEPRAESVRALLPRDQRGLVVPQRPRNETDPRRTSDLRGRREKGLEGKISETLNVSLLNAEQQGVTSFPNP